MCNHPGAVEIDRRLADNEETYPQIQAYLTAGWPHIKVPSIGSLSKHRKNHLRLDILRDGRLSLKNGVLVDAAGREIESIGIAPALRTIIAIGLQNMLTDPSRVSTRDTLEAIRHLKAIGSSAGGDGIENVMDAWSEAVNRPTRKAQPKQVVAVEGVIEAEVSELPVLGWPAPPELPVWDDDDETDEAEEDA